MTVGDTFIWSPFDPSQGRKEHLYIIVSDPKKNGGRFVAFNLTKSRGGPRALTLKIGDHPFIKKYDSDINFGDGLILSVVNLQDQIARGWASPNAPLNRDLVERIARFALEHPAVSGEIQKMIASEWRF